MMEEQLVLLPDEELVTAEYLEKYRLRYAAGIKDKTLLKELDRALDELDKKLDETDLTAVPTVEFVRLYR